MRLRQNTPAHAWLHILASLDVVRNIDLVLVQAALASHDPFLELRVHG